MFPTFISMINPQKIFPWTKLWLTG